MNKLFYKGYADNFDINLISEVYLMDAQIAYKILKVCNILDKNIDKKVVNFINSNTNYWIFSEIPVTNLKELNYAIKLAHNYDINYNYNKVINYINTFEDSIDVQDIYYSYLLKDELSMPFIAKDVTLRVIAENIQDFNSKSLKEKFYLIYLYNKLELNSKHFDDAVKEFSKKNIEYKILNTNREDDFYYLTKISDELDIELDLDFITNEIKKYSCKNGGYSIEKVLEAPNTMSTYRMIKVIIDYGIEIDDKELSRLSVFVNSIKGTEGGYYYNPSSNPSDLYNYDNNLSFISFYYGDFLNTMIK